MAAPPRVDAIAQAKRELGPGAKTAAVFDRAGQIVRDQEQTPTARTAPAAKPAPKAKARPTSSRRQGAGRAAGRAVDAIPGTGPQATALLLTFIGVTLGTVILVQVISPRGSKAVATVIDTTTTAVKRLADPADPIIPAA